MRAREVFCEGVILENGTLTLTEKAFACMSFTDTLDKLESELPQTDFPQYRSELVRLLNRHRDTVTLSGDKLGRTSVIQHQVNLETGSKPFFIPNYRLPISQRPVVEELVQAMKRDGVVTPSTSPYNSPLLLVPKKDGTFRLVIDYRKLNAQTIPDRTPMPVINDVLAQLGGAKVFSSLDLLSGYWQVPLAEESKPSTAFSTHKEHLQFEVMPFGLTSAPLTFIRLMQVVLGEIPNVMCYLDDIIIYSNSVDEHFMDLERVLNRLREAGLKIKIKKMPVPSEGIGIPRTSGYRRRNKDARRKDQGHCELPRSKE